MSIWSNHTFVVNGVSVDLGGETLKDGLGGRIDLRPQAFAVLRYLAEHANRLVTKDELMRAVWRATAVTDDSLVQCVHEIRRALQDGERSALKTVPKLGYKFVLPNLLLHSNNRSETGTPDIHEAGGPDDVADPLARKHRDEMGLELGPAAKASIAVLPFVNLSCDPEHGLFADGLTLDLITDLCRAGDLFVVAADSSFAYKGKSIDPRGIGRELSVRYVVTGNVRRAGDRLRINVQLIDTNSSAAFWADRFDLQLSDLYSVQDEMVGGIVEAVLGRLVPRQISQRRGPSNLAAYDLCLRGRALVLQSPEGAREAQLLFEKAVGLEPESSEAHRWLALSLERAWAVGGEPKEPSLQRASAELRTAIDLDFGDPGAHWMLANLLESSQCWQEAEAEFTLALELGPNNADAWAMFSELMVLKGRAGDAIDHIEKAFRLDPHPPGWYYWFVGQAQYLDQRYEAAIKSLRHEATYRTVSRRTLAASLAQLGQLEEARHEARLFLASSPSFTIRHWTETTPFQDRGAGEHFVDGYRKAGLPE